ncbi:MAG TPA: hypothetical protein VHV77_18195, partial [Pirellulales bacterium]|nr:hypothetical protein [Pirellulales bacterium]
MPSVALCPRCQGIIAIASVAIPNVGDAQRELRCPRCASSFRVEEVMGTFTIDPPLATPVDGDEVLSAKPQATELTSEEPREVAPSLNGSTNIESAGEAWTESLSAAEGATVVSGDEDDAVSRPYHEEPEYNRSLAVEGSNGSAWPELAAAIA